MGFTPIADYGVIGNLETCPLVGRDGSIDWCCFPHIESSSVFAGLLDDDGGGHFSIQPAGESTPNRSTSPERTSSGHALGPIRARWSSPISCPSRTEWRSATPRAPSTAK